MSSDPFSRFLLPVLLVAASCSVKENRAACPCSLMLDLSGLPVSPVVVEVTGEGFSKTGIVHADTVMVLSVPKGRTTVSVVGGALADPDGGVQIPPGEEAPPLYLFHASFSSAAEQMVLPVVLHKQYCALELIFSGPAGYGPPFEVEVEGNVSGWERDGTPAEGRFFHRLLPGPETPAVLRLPRQGDDSLVMHILFSDRVVRTFALGTYMAEAGYDWTEPDLKDLTLKVDVSVTSVTLSSGGWTRTEDIELWI